MKLEHILTDYLSQPKLELGDRSTYVGASDVGQCPRKAVLSKAHPETHDVHTLIRLERGNIVESIVEKALTHAGIDYVTQLELSHPDKPYTAHLDFAFIRDTEIAILETKSVSTLPEEPYPSWVAQIHFQMGLAELDKALPARGGILAVDLNSGDFRLFNGYTHNSILFNGLLKKAGHIWDSLQGNCEPETEKSTLCIYCAYRSDCPEYAPDGLPDLPVVDLVMDYQAAKAQEKKVKEDVSRLREQLELAVLPYGEARAGDYLLKLGTSTRTGFDTKSFQAEHPELAKEYVTTSSYTRLYVS